MELSQVASRALEGGVVEILVLAEVSMKNLNSVNIIVISDLQYNLKTIQKDDVFTAICVAVSIAHSSLSIFIVRSFVTAVLSQSLLSYTHQ